jgi:SH3 domain protein
MALNFRRTRPDGLGAVTQLFPSLLVLALAWIALVTLGAGVAAAEQAWVKGDLRLNLRSGGGNEYRILGTVETGDSVKILMHGTDWTKIATQDGKEGWVPAGYLDAVPPPVARLASAEAETASLKSDLEKLRAEATQLRESNAALSANDEGQKKELDTLKLQNLELRAVSRYQEWLTGGGLLGGGMLLGAWLHSRSANRRPSTRIRL